MIFFETNRDVEVMLASTSLVPSVLKRGHAVPGTVRKRISDRYNLGLKIEEGKPE